MNKQASISFLVPAFNCAQVLPQAIDSIFQDNIGSEDEVVIVNDGSTDETQAVIDGLASRYPQIRTCRHRHNKGSAAAGRNTAIEAARHDLFFALDSDNILVPGSVPPLAEFLSRKGADAAVFQEVRFFTDNPGHPTHSWVYREEITLADALAGHQWPGPDGNYMFTRDSWLRAGRYDEGWGIAVDSWAFGIRQLVSGSKMVTMPGTYYLHRYGHQSTWMRDSAEGLISLKALKTLLPWLQLLEPESVEYILGPEGRMTWFEKLDQRPLRVRGSALGEGGRVVANVPPPVAPLQKAQFTRRLRRYVARKISPE